MANRFEVLASGAVYDGTGTDKRNGAISRVVTTPNGLLCGTNLTKDLGVNDFVVSLSRSVDGGLTWSNPAAVWPGLIDKTAIYGSLSRGADGHLYLFGARTPIDVPGELFWSDATHGFKQNEMYWSVSRDEGKTWSDPKGIPMPIPGTAEAPGAMCVTKAGTWLVVYAPYNTMDPAFQVERNQVIVMRSTDQGKSWSHSKMIQWDDKEIGGAEAWCVELSDGRLLGSTWAVNHAKSPRLLPNAYAISHDQGKTWSKTASTDIFGHTTVLAPYTDGRAIFGYVQRLPDSSGIGLAIVRPTDTDFGIESNELIFRVEKPTQSGDAPDDNTWSDFNFGEPSITLLPDNKVLVTHWQITPKFSGTRYILLQMKS